MYPRAIVLEHQHQRMENGKILATFECYTNKIPVFPVYESADSGKSWEFISEIVAGGVAEVDSQKDIRRPVRYDSGIRARLFPYHGKFPWRRRLF